ncbi:50S ribosomal protein L25/general stress protein Ctc [Brachybacterium sp. JHP9]|uniref:Large ribosomal subunit protein bL25 n=1 Tax=Brachybacterium equifaecis TaxID=2910770 RepID=A0ABT0QXB3_9MICO|nr:50S ribosomal protein L25/general stress protein Ctc [Brachybacterium equifaecis]MCL6421793.1 50S ribosomal protein L25/general stress protein Ctc [Brachybacterium equifaecis]
MAEKLNVEKREEFGKGAARRIRAEHKVPAVLYGHGTEPLHLVLPGHETALAARNANALFELVLPDGETHLGLIKEIQRHPLRRSLTHLDLILVRRGEKVEVDIPVFMTGEPVAPAIAVVDQQALTLSVDALNVPESIEIDVEGKEEGFQLFAGDVTLPSGAELVTDAELLVLSVQLPRVDEELEAAIEEAEAGGAEAGAESSEESEDSEGESSEESDSEE